MKLQKNKRAIVSSKTQWSFSFPFPWKPPRLQEDRTHECEIVPVASHRSLHSQSLHTQQKVCGGNVEAFKKAYYGRH